MLIKTVSDEFVKNEKIQIFIRLAFVTITNINIYYYHYYVKNSETHSFAYIMIIPTFVFIYNLFYLYIIKHFPYKFQEYRIALTVILDIIFTTYVMYLVGALTAYYAGVYLWFSIGYAMRYNKKIAYLAYFTTLISWTTLITTSIFWKKHIDFGIGWLATFIVSPLYYFVLIDKLHQNIKKLHIYAQTYEHKALHDELTGLPNRILFDRDLKNHIENFNTKKEKFALFFIDLDKFKIINDTLGHDIGDLVLIEVSKRLKSVASHIYRLGGDEFVCIYKYETKKELINMAKKFSDTLRNPCPNSKVKLSGSIGIACFPSDAQTEYDIKKRADTAMYAAKKSGKNRYCFYEEIS